MCTAVNDVRTHAKRAAFSKLIHLVRELTEKFGETDLFPEVV
jgi:hypothetical protein